MKSRWGLASRVFDDAEAAARAHMFPWTQKAPVVHVDRPTWTLDEHSSREEQDRAFALELQIEDLAEALGGEFVGT